MWLWCAWSLDECWHWHLCSTVFTVSGYVPLAEITIVDRCPFAEYWPQTKSANLSDRFLVSFSFLSLSRRRLHFFRLRWNAMQFRESDLHEVVATVVAELQLNICNRYERCYSSSAWLPRIESSRVELNRILFLANHPSRRDVKSVLPFGESFWATPSPVPYMPIVENMTASTKPEVHEIITNTAREWLSHDR